MSSERRRQRFWRSKESIHSTLLAQVAAAGGNNRPVGLSPNDEPDFTPFVKR